MALTYVSFSWRRRSLVVSSTARVMFGWEFISIILRNLSSIRPALRDINRNSGRNPYPKISVKNYVSYKRSEGFAAEFVRHFCGHTPSPRKEKTSAQQAHLLGYGRGTEVGRGLATGAP